MAKLFRTDKKMFNTLFKIAQQGFIFWGNEFQSLGPWNWTVTTQFYTDQYAVPIYGDSWLKL